MRSKKFHGQAIFDLEKKHTSHSLKARDKGRKSPTKKISPKGKRKLSFQSNKPGLLKGRKFFLDIQGSGKVDNIKHTILQLGGTVEEFNSKDVYCTITNRVSQDEIVSYRNQNKRSTPSPLSGLAPSPHCAPTPSPLQQISSNKGRVNSPLSTDSPQTPQSLDQKGITVTRGKSLLNKAVSSTQKQGSSNLLQLAQKWGTKVLHLEHFIKWTKEKTVSECLQVQVSKRNTTSSSTHHSKSGTFKVKKLKSPFIKVESQTRKYRPFFVELEEWPVICAESAPGTCPFEKPRDVNLRVEENDQVSDKETNKNEPSQHISDKSSEKDPEKEPKAIKDKKEDVRCGYCECCSVRFNDLSKHLKSDQHRSFARNDSNYVGLDSVMKRGKTFDEFLETVRQKYEEECIVDDTQRASCTSISESEHEEASSPERNDVLHNDSCNEEHPGMIETNTSDKENQPLQSVKEHLLALEQANLPTRTTLTADPEDLRKRSVHFVSERPYRQNAADDCQGHELGLEAKDLENVTTEVVNAEADDRKELCQEKSPIKSQTFENNSGKQCFPNNEHLQIESTLLVSNRVNVNQGTEVSEPHAMNGDEPGTTDSVTSTVIRLNGREQPTGVNVCQRTSQLAVDCNENVATGQKLVLENGEDCFVDDGLISDKQDPDVRSNKGDGKKGNIGKRPLQDSSANVQGLNVASNNNGVRTLRSSRKCRRDARGVYDAGQVSSKNVPPQSGTQKKRRGRPKSKNVTLFKKKECAVMAGSCQSFLQKVTPKDTSKPDKVTTVQSSQSYLANEKKIDVYSPEEIVNNSESSTENCGVSLGAKSFLSRKEDTSFSGSSTVDINDHSSMDSTKATLGDDSLRELSFTCQEKEDTHVKEMKTENMETISNCLSRTANGSEENGCVELRNNVEKTAFTPPKPVNDDCRRGLLHDHFYESPKLRDKCPIILDSISSNLCNVDNETFRGDAAQSWHGMLQCNETTTNDWRKAEEKSTSIGKLTKARTSISNLDALWSNEEVRQSHSDSIANESSSPVTITVDAQQGPRVEDRNILKGLSGCLGTNSDATSTKPISARSSSSIIAPEPQSTKYCDESTTKPQDLSPVTVRISPVVKKSLPFGNIYIISPILKHRWTAQPTPEKLCEFSSPSSDVEFIGKISDIISGLTFSAERKGKQKIVEARRDRGLNCKKSLDLSPSQEVNGLKDQDRSRNVLKDNVDTGKGSKDENKTVVIDGNCHIGEVGSEYVRREESNRENFDTRSQDDTNEDVAKADKRELYRKRENKEKQKENVSSKGMQRRKRGRNKLSPDTHESTQRKRSCTDETDAVDEEEAAPEAGSAPTFEKDLVLSKLSVKQLIQTSFKDVDSSLADVHSFLDEDCRKGISMHERLKTRRRMCSSTDVSSCSSSYVPPQRPKYSREAHSLRVKSPKTRQRPDGDTEKRNSTGGNYARSRRSRSRTAEDSPVSETDRISKYTQKRRSYRFSSTPCGKKKRDCGDQDTFLARDHSYHTQESVSEDHDVTLSSTIPKKSCSEESSFQKYDDSQNVSRSGHTRSPLKVSAEDSAECKGRILRSRKTPNNSLSLRLTDTSEFESPGECTTNAVMLSISSALRSRGKLDTIQNRLRKRAPTQKHLPCRRRKLSTRNFKCRKHKEDDIFGYKEHI